MNTTETRIVPKSGSAFVGRGWARTKAWRHAVPLAPSSIRQRFNSAVTLRESLATQNAPLPQLQMRQVKCQHPGWELRESGPRRQSRRLQTQTRSSATRRNACYHAARRRSRRGSCATQPSLQAQLEGGKSQGRGIRMSRLFRILDTESEESRLIGTTSRHYPAIHLCDARQDPLRSPNLLTYTPDD